MRGGPRSAFSRGCVPRPTAHPPRHAVPRATFPASNPRPPVTPLTSPRRTAGLPRVPRGGAGEEGAFPINSGRADASPARRARFLSGACRNGKPGAPAPCRPGSERPHAELRLHLLGAAQGSPRAPAQLFPTVSGRPGPSPRVRHLGVGPEPAPPRARPPAQRAGQGPRRPPVRAGMRSGTAGPRAGCGDRAAAAASRRQGDRRHERRPGAGSATGPRGRPTRKGRSRTAGPPSTRPAQDPEPRRPSSETRVRTAGCAGGQRAPRTDPRASAAAHLALGGAVRPRPGVEPRSRGRRAASWAQARAG